jgi:hypothetical protein
MIIYFIQTGKFRLNTNDIGKAKMCAESIFYHNIIPEKLRRYRGIPKAYTR